MSAVQSIRPWCPGPDYPRWIDRLDDGTTVAVRPVRADDAARESAFIEALSPQSRRLRFLGQVGTPGARLLDQLTNIDYDDEMAFAAVRPDDVDEAFLGVSRYAAYGEKGMCECAVTVRDDWQYLGLGTLLMRHLIDIARAQGFTQMISIDSRQNEAMAALAADLGFERLADPDDARQVIHRLRL